MSTTFGIILQKEFGKRHTPLSEIPTDETTYLSEVTIIPIARQIGCGNGMVEITWLNDLVHLLSYDTPVIAMDNGNGDVNTLFDLMYSDALYQNYINNKIQ